MKKVAVYTKDKYLFQKILLDLLGEYECIILENGDKPSMCQYEIWDVDTMGENDGGKITVSLGANSHISRPFSVGYIKKVLENTEAVAKIICDEKLRTIRFKNRIIQLTEIEFSLFFALAKREGEWVERRLLLDEVWGRDTDGTLLNVYIHYLREKLECEGEKVIISSRKFGYKIDERFFKKGGAE